MRQDPGISTDAIRACLVAHYGVVAGEVRFRPLGFDAQAAVCEVAARDGQRFFLKLRLGPVHEPALRAAHALHAAGVDPVLAPLPARSGRPWCDVDGLGVGLYPWIDGRDAMTAGMSHAQWRAFGAAMRAVHDSRLAGRFRDDLRTEAFALPSAAAVRALAPVVASGNLPGPVAGRFAAFWQANAARIEATIARSEAMGRTLRDRQHEQVLCHGDIHAANILVANDGAIHLIDWDAPPSIAGARPVLRRRLDDRPRGAAGRGSGVLRRVRPGGDRPRDAGVLPLRALRRGSGRVRPKHPARPAAERRHPRRGSGSGAGCFDPGGWLALAEAVVLPPAGDRGTGPAGPGRNPDTP